MLGKILTVLISPLGTSLLLGLLALGLTCWRHQTTRRLAWGLASLALLWLWFWSTPLASDALRGAIEAKAGPRTLQQVGTAPVLVVLGGGVSGPRLPQRPYPDLTGSADRMWHAARLYHAGKSQRIVLSGGTVRTGDGSEAEAMKSLLLDLGVPSHAIELETGSINTRSNATRTARLLSQQNIDTVILVTSALHMPRARLAFEQAGLKTLPAPTDFEVIEIPFDILHLLPDTSALSGSSRAFKELIGSLV